MDLTTIAGTGQGLTASDWTTSVQNGTAVASLTMQHSVRSVTIAVSVDAQSQEIVVKLSGQATQAGVTGAPWGLAGLDLNAGRLIVPANTGIVFDREHPGWGLHADVSERLAGADARVRDACRQHWVLYSTDPQYLFKQLRIATRGSSTLDLSISTQANGPWPGATSVPLVEWRLKAFAGNWRAAAGTYRDWLVAHRPRVPRATDAWTQNIHTVASLNYTGSSADLHCRCGERRVLDMRRESAADQRVRTVIGFACIGSCASASVTQYDAPIASASSLKS